MSVVIIISLGACFTRIIRIFYLALGTILNFVVCKKTSTSNMSPSKPQQHAKDTGSSNKLVAITSGEILTGSGNIIITKVREQNSETEKLKKYLKKAGQ